MRTSLGLVLVIWLGCLILALAAHSPAADPSEPEMAEGGEPRPAPPPPRLGPSAPGGDVTAEERSRTACSPGRCALTVRVVTPDGRSVSGAHVRIEDADFDGAPREGETADDGVLSLDGLDPVAHRVEVRALGCALASRIVGSAPDGDTRVEILVSPGPPLRGSVRCVETDAPIPRARVSIHRAWIVPHLSGIPMPWRIGPLLGSARTDADGTYEVAHVPGETAVAVVEAQGWATATRLFTRHGPASQGWRARHSKAVPRLSLAPLDVRLGPGASLVGRVLDAEGAPVGDALVEIVARDLGFDRSPPCDGTDGALDWNRSLFGPSERYWGPLFLRDLWRHDTTHTDALGIFHFGGLAAGEPCLLRAQTTEARSPETVVRPANRAASKTEEPDTDANGLTLTLTLSPPGAPPTHGRRRVATPDAGARCGRVMDDAGRPVAGARIERPQVVSCDRDGLFRLPWAHVFQRVRVAADGHEPAEEWLGKDAHEPLEVVLPRVARVQIAVALSGEARPPAAVHVLVPKAGEDLGLGSTLHARHVLPWPDERATRAVFPVQVAAGVTQLAVEAEGFLPWSTAVALESGREVVVPAHLDAGLVLEGVLRDDEGRPLANVPFKLWAPETECKGRTRADGYFRVTGLPRAIPRAGFFRVPGHATSPVLPVETWGTPVDLELTRLARVIVRVVDQDGYPVSRVSVAAQDDKDRVRGGGRSTRAGRVVLEVAPGTWRLGARDGRRNLFDWSEAWLDLRPGTTTYRILPVVR